MKSAPERAPGFAKHPGYLATASISCCAPMKTDTATARGQTAKDRDRVALFARIHAVVRQVPRGQVATYGQIALIAGAATPRLVGRALRELPPRRAVPWHRIVNSQGKISPRDGRDAKTATGTATGIGGPDREQRRRLKAEGVFLDDRGRVDFASVAWTGPSWAWLDARGYDVEALVLKSRSQPRRGAWKRWAL